MKIFSWVHKTFNHSVLKEGFAQNVTKKTETSMNEVDRHALLKQVDFDVDALHGWRDGILTIGTFGFETLKPSSEPKEYLVLESEEEEDDDEEGEKSIDVHEEDDDIIDYFEDEELNPLMFTTFGHKSEGANDEKAADLIIGAYELNIESNYNTIMAMEGDEKKKKGDRRITLADLFLADADVNMTLEPGKVLQVAHKKTDARSKSSLWFAKKLIPRVKEDSHPIKNFQRLMRRMLKRKIHPEIDDKIYKSYDDQAGEIGLAANGGFGTFESVSLLPTQGRHLGKAGGGAAFHDSKGLVLVATSKQILSPQNAEIDEASAFKEGLRFAIRNGFKPVVCASRQTKLGKVAES